MAQLSPEEKAMAMASASPEQKEAVLADLTPAEREAVAAAQSSLAEDSMVDSKMKIEEIAHKRGISQQEEDGMASSVQPAVEERPLGEEKEGEQKGEEGAVEEEEEDPMSIRFGGKTQSLSTVKEASVFANEARCVSMRTMSAALKMLEVQAEEIECVKLELGKIKRRSLLTTAANDGRAKGLVAEFPTLTRTSRVQRVKGEGETPEGTKPLETGLGLDEIDGARQATYNPNRPRLFKQFGWTMHDADP